MAEYGTRPSGYNRVMMEDDRMYNDNITENYSEPARDLTEYEMRVEKLKQAAQIIAKYDRKCAEHDEYREKTKAMLSELGTRYSELRSIEVPDYVIKELLAKPEDEVTEKYAQFRDDNGKAI